MTNDEKLGQFLDDMLVIAEESKQAIKNKSATAEDYKIVQTVLKFALDLEKVKVRAAKDEPEDIKDLADGPKAYAQRLRIAKRAVDSKKLSDHNKSIINNAKRNSVSF